MNVEKQIEERVELSDIIDYAMRDWDNYIDECREEDIPPIDTFEEWIADAVLRNGYRKQEWISVDERLPEGKAPIIVTDGEKVIVAYRNWLYRSNSTGKLRCPANYGNGMEITHWMPLPEAPKMKGGE